jgi:hypothetical protein
MRLLIGTCVPLLVLPLAVTTPVGTGEGVHQADLLHPLFPHLHLVNGRLLVHDALGAERRPQADPTTPGPAIGGGAGDDAASTELALSPTVPLPAEALPEGRPTGHVVVDLTAPTGRVEAPPDAPPTSAA